MVVSSDGASLDGIITERDVALGLAIYGTESCALPVSTLMITTVEHVRLKTVSQTLQK